jgi:cleavage and polyadenylation specificity factor subunit 1
MHILMVLKTFCSYEMLPLEEQLELAHQIGTTRYSILKDLVDLSVGTSFL